MIVDSYIFTCKFEKKIPVIMSTHSTISIQPESMLENIIIQITEMSKVL